jgi:DNA mismatch endonuclease (patch repair protein)
MSVDPVRSRIMAAIKSKDTKPELAVRKLAHSLGYRFRLHGKDLPGKPDIVFPARQAVIFVHGCYWHGHDCDRGNRTPKTNTAYWKEKIRRNISRDAANIEAIEASGWRVLIIWECQIRERENLAKRLSKFLDRSRSPYTSPR